MQHEKQVHVLQDESDGEKPGSKINQPSAMTALDSSALSRSHDKTGGGARSRR